MSKILVIAPVPSHPPDSGARMRIFSLLTSLAAAGHTISYLHVQLERHDIESLPHAWRERVAGVAADPRRLGDLEAMRQRWDDYFCLDPGIKAGRLARQVVNYGLWRALRRPPIPFRIDDWYPNALDAWIRRCAASMRYGAVIVNYVYLSRALEAFGPETLKLIDTHDIFGDRHQIFRKQGALPTWFFTTPREEAKGLRRADVIMAIQEEETEYFKRLVPERPVITVGHCVAVHPAPLSEQSANPTLLFIGTHNQPNVLGLTGFVRSVLPELRAEFPDLVLHVVGSVGAALRLRPPACVIEGRVPDLTPYYKSAWIVVAPLMFGTGLKIKTVEALSFGKAVVATPVAMEGLERGAGWAFRVAHDSAEMVREIRNLILDKGARCRLQENAALLMREYNRSAVSPLLQVLENGAADSAGSGIGPAQASEHGT